MATYLGAEDPDGTLAIASMDDGALKQRSGDLGVGACAIDRIDDQQGRTVHDGLGLDLIADATLPQQRPEPV